MASGDGLDGLSRGSCGAGPTGFFEEIRCAAAGGRLAPNSRFSLKSSQPFGGPITLEPEAEDCRNRDDLVSPATLKSFSRACGPRSPGSEYSDLNSKKGIPARALSRLIFHPGRSQELTPLSLQREAVPPLTKEPRDHNHPAPFRRRHGGSGPPRNWFPFLRHTLRFT